MTEVDRLAGVVDRLVSPGGCPWDGEQTHRSLLPYLVEEAYEVVDAVEAGDDTDLREELGDLLLQVVFHARVAAGRGAFDLQDVAGAVADKLVSRHPHVFDAAAAPAPDADDVRARWEDLKALEKPERGPLDGIPRHLPALARAQKVLARLERAGLPLDAGPHAGPDAGPDAGTGGSTAAGDVAADLLAVVDLARRSGVDAEQVLREHLHRIEATGARRDRPSPIRSAADGVGAD